MAVATLLTIDISLPGGLVEGSSGLAQARTAGFTVPVLAQLFNCLDSRSERRSAFGGLFSNPLLWAAIAVSLLLQVLVVSLRFFNHAFDTPCEEEAVDDTILAKPSAKLVQLEVAPSTVP